MSEILTSPSGQRMITYIAPIYGESRVMQALFQVSGLEVDDLRSWAEDLSDQITPATATWGLKYWEQLLGIAVDEEKPIEQRREYIASRIRSQGTPTRKLIEDAAAAFTGGTISVTNSATPYTVKIQFIDDIGTPPNMDDFRAFVDNVMPAHLSVEYSYRYYLIRDINGIMTIAQMQALPLNVFAPFV